jgi:Putative adhesin
MKIQFLLVVAALLICCYSGSEVAGQTPGNDSKQKSATKIEMVGTRNETIWRGNIPPSGLVEIAGILGDIHIETTSGNEAEVFAVKKGKTDEFDQVQMRVEESAGGVKICEAFPLLEGGGKSQCLSSVKFNSINFADNRELHLRFDNGDSQSFRLAEVRMQFRIRVPAGAQLVARTLRGNIEAKGITAKLQAVATNGNVTASLGTTDFSGPIDLKSLNGGVILTVPDEINAQVYLDTMNGEIATDLPITVSGGFRGNYLEGTIGRGGQRLSLSTLNGNVEIRRAHDSSRSVAKVIPETKRNEFAWRGKVPPDGLVEIIGISGDIRTEVSTGDEVEIIAIKDGDKDEIDQVQIRVEESANGVKVCAAFPLLEGQGQPECLADGRWNSMSMSQSGNSDRKLSLRYESGKKQSFRVADIRVQFKVRIPAGTQFNAQVRLEAWSGEIATDFPVIVRGRLPSKSLVGTIGQGGQKVTLRTVFGNVELRRAQ